MRRVCCWLALLLVSGCLATRADTGPTARFGFRWETDWAWAQLETRADGDSLQAGTAARRLHRSLPLDQARVLLRHLAALPDIASIRRLPDRAAIDRPVAGRQAALRALESVLNGYAPRDDLAGMLEAAEKLAAARAQVRDWFLPELTGRAYRPVAARGPRHPRLRLRLDFRPADLLLQRLSSGDTTDADWNRLADEPIFRQLVLHRGPARLSREQLVGWWRRAADPDPLNRLYEWVYPGSYYDYGGVAVQAAGYRAALGQIRAGSATLTARVLTRLSRYLPADLELNATVHLLFAGDADGWATGTGLGIDLEHFGDDFNYLERVIAHECFHRAQAAALLPVTTLLPEDDPERALHDGLLEAVWREGIASYVGSVWTQSPAPERLAQDFRLLESAFDALRRHDMVAYRQRIREGLNMAGALYRAGWRMAQVIEQKEGPEAVAELQTLGPAVFFARYVAAYRQATPGDVPAAQRFSPDFEKAVGRIVAGLEAASLLHAAHIARLPDAAQARRAALQFLTASEKEPESALALVCLGDAFARRRRDFEMAARLLVPGLRGLGAQAGEWIRTEGYLLLSLHALPQAVAVFQAGVEISPNDPQRYYFLGEARRLSGDMARAREAYRRALALQAGYEPARRALGLLGSAPGR